MVTLTRWLKKAAIYPLFGCAYVVGAVRGYFRLARAALAEGFERGTKAIMKD